MIANPSTPLMAGLQPYPEYKESGLPWSAQLPSHWKQERAKWLFTKMDRPVGENDEVVTCFRDGKVTLRKNRRSRGFTEAIYEFGYQGIRKGDLVIHAMDAFAGAVGVSDSNGKGTPVYAVCQPKTGVNAHYYAFIIREMARSQWILALSRGIRERSTDFRYDTFGGQRVPLPPPSEQAAMVRFLDWANGRLERAIRAKRKVIALLHEQKQAIIHRAVTRGLNAEAAFKPSGIPWLGNIPEHWEVWPLRRCISIRSGDFIDGSKLKNERSDSSPIPVIGGNGIMGFADRSNVSGLTIVIGRVGALCGNVHLVKEAAWITDNALRITRMVGFDAGYLAEQLRVMNLNLLANANAQPLVTGGVIKTQRVVKPPQDEQQRITDALQTLYVPVTSALSRLDREIGLLREYRTRLVADVVTGKLDVRPAARDLPAEPRAPELAPEESSEPETEETEA
ncbi:MAG TPA: restriction endonuclease subunit S [Verrucomicrobiota bacterium]|nr:restriction endonuclease subunit S [Verrucomicrobiota bacterium]HRZ35218.1 restriction endonuclease subunit S [Candidatus Paceibacterota bacterium]HRZ54160.1 restriction endonuclease subunit S [Candidatus Paceibacterota bacterium]